MSNQNGKRGAKRGVLGTGRAKQLDKTKDATTGADEDDDADEQDREG